jgi:hypothetical protein
MGNPITGRTAITLGGEPRVIACDMNAAAVLYERFGEHWSLWLLERFAGKEEKLDDGTKVRRIERPSVADLRGVLYALLATDREESHRIETELSVGAALSAFVIDRLHVDVSKCILVGFGVPGEAIEAALSDAAAPRGNERVATDGIGTKP